MGKILVSYISFSGVTREVALEIAKKLKADVKEIIPKEPYTSEDLDWRDSNSRSSIEMRDSSSRPEIEDMGDISSYDTIILGYPIWWETFPREINTFIEKYDLAFKTIIPFCTSGGSDIETSIEDLKKCLVNSKIIEGKKLDVDSVNDFVDALDLD